jgi:hypothetical protein
MRLFKLIPRNLESDLWKFSTYRGPALVRAADEMEARTTAAHRFFGGYKSELARRGIVTGYAWYSPSLVLAEEVEDDAHSSKEQVVELAR